MGTIESRNQITMALRIALLLATVASASAFSSSAGLVKGMKSVSGIQRHAPKSLRMSVADMEGVGEETGNSVFDPLGFSKVSDESLAWFRAAELKHGRVAMAACTGWITGLGYTFPGYISPST